MSSPPVGRFKKSPHAFLWTACLHGINSLCTKPHFSIPSRNHELLLFYLPFVLFLNRIRASIWYFISLIPAIWRQRISHSRPAWAHSETLAHQTKHKANKEAKQMKKDKWFPHCSGSLLTSFNLNTDWGFFVCFVNLTSAGVTWEKGIPTEKRVPSDWSVGKCVGHFFS